MTDTYANSESTCRHVRNICVLAHVDHGKTTLVDSLLASNGIITQRMAGKLRYMDSRLDEQERGITMKCSSISLVYEYKDCDTENKTELVNNRPSKYLINVIDSPGHVDFFGEVSTALRVCDGCFILVDVIEGICSQTRTALQHAWLARVRPILVLNKIDRLFIERQLSPLDIYIHLTQTLEQVNAFVGELFASEVLGKISTSSSMNQSEIDDQLGNLDLNRKQVFYDWSSGLDDVDDDDVYFSPENGNVIFASAIDGWGFTIADFATVLSKSKLGFSANVLKKTLWGDYYLNVKEKRIQKGAQSKAKKPLFVSLVLENLSKVYEKFILKRDKIEMAKIAEMLNIKLTPRDINHSDHKTALIQLFSQWIPLPNALLKAVCDVVPCPSEISDERVERIMCSNDTCRFDSLPKETQVLKDSFLKCQAKSKNSTIPLIVCISKMFAFERNLLPQFRTRPLTQEEIKERREKIKTERKIHSDSTVNGEIDTNSEDRVNEEVEEEGAMKTDQNTVFIGFARVFSGILRRGDWVYVLGPKHDPKKMTNEMIDQINASNASLIDLRSDQHVTRVQINDLYLLMGRDMQLVEEVSAGHICGIGSLESHVIKSATLSSTPYCPSLVDHYSNSIPILRVAVEPCKPSDMPLLINALRMLNQADACVDVKIQETGEHVIIATGEVHLERCKVDLISFLPEDIEFNISEPIVPFRETIIEPPKVDMLNENISEQKIIVTSMNQKFASLNTTESDKSQSNTLQPSSGIIEQFTPNKKVRFHICAKPLPSNVIETMESNQNLLLELMQFQRKNVMQNTNTNYLIDSCATFTKDFCNSIHALRTKLETQFKEAGWPEDTVDQIWSVGPKFSGTNLLINRLDQFNHQSCFLEKVESKFEMKKMERNVNDPRYQFENSFINGFQLCTQAGPLCDEPMMGVAFIVHQWQHITEDTTNVDSPANISDPFGPLSGQIMSTIKECCRLAFQAQPQRLMAAMFSCIIQINSDALGR
ncbi:hypothetical protein RDWZM_005591 [Blomia tropicalis]|uniref:Tr-type G domain-containing protein n=1 Tax=Blomia tropicalis TaxID=40697 RepID=A0A9Q0M6I2_BLOTA|nr:hypothetical protein RDWZM_005591 [Blomia tropicalis]